MITGILIIITLVVIFAIVGFAISTLPPPPPDPIYTLFVFDKLHDNGDVFSSSRYYVSGFDNNGTKQVLDLYGKDDYMKIQINTTSSFECPSYGKINCEYMDQKL
jgi:hypothetical protein